MKKHTKIKAWERDQIAILLSSKTSVRSISRLLGRSHTAILNEIKRNSQAGVYQAIRANDLSSRRNTKSRRSNPLKDPTIYSYVLEKLRCGWSPEQIAGRLRKENDGETVICHETIYQYIHGPDGRKRKLFEYLTQKHQKRRQWFGRSIYRKGIPGRISIDLRPEVINQRRRFGDWEVDSVEGKAHKKGIQTFLERKTRYYQTLLVENIDSEYGIKAQLQIFSGLPPKARKSATFDNGRENFNHTKLNIHLGMKTYFCDPNSAWQKGSNENHNGVLRRYIPKKTDLTTISQLELDAITEEINDRPRKCLNYATPKEAFLAQLGNYQLQSRKVRWSDSN